MKQYLDIIEDGKTLSEAHMIAAMTLIMEGGAQEDELARFLTVLAQRGETVEEITGAARVLREKALSVAAPYGAVDCCGTGGDKKGTYNISTAAALVAAGAGIPVAKHGNRASSSKSGAADVLEALGVNLDMQPELQEEALKTIGFAFLMAPRHHSAMGHVAAVRKRLGTRTIFNILGPLANPAGTRRQLVGVYERGLVLKMAQVLKNLGAKRAWVVHGSDGLDEITVCGETYVAVLDEEGRITERVLMPADFGLSPPKDDSRLLGGDAEKNAAALRAILEGQACPYRDIVLANAAAVLCVHGSAATLDEGIKKAKKSIDSGNSMSILKDYINLSRRVTADVQ